VVTHTPHKLQSGVWHKLNSTLTVICGIQAGKQWTGGSVHGLFEGTIQKYMWMSGEKPWKSLWRQPVPHMKYESVPSKYNTGRISMEWGKPG
jgi:hypothetical protein